MPKHATARKEGKGGSAQDRRRARRALDRGEVFTDADRALMASALAPLADPSTPERRAHLESFELALPDELAPAETLPPPTGSPEPEPAAQPATARGPVAWTANFCPEAALTDDGRAFAPGSIRWRELPLSLMAMIETQEGHDGATVAGRIDRIWREGNMVKASGVFDAGEYGQEIARMVADGTLRGISVDIAIHQYEIGAQSQWFDDDGNWAPTEPDAEAAEPTLEEILFDTAAERPILLVTDGVIGASTVCPFPAFADANISLAASGAPVWTVTMQAGFTAVERPPLALVAAAVEAPDTPAVEPAEPGLTAAAAGLAPLAPPPDWFTDPELAELTPVTITDDGRIFGHAWAWETCHIAYRECVTAPHTATANAYFHLGEIECDDGSRLPIGKVTIDAPHAGQRLSRADATAHYDHTGTVAAHVVCGEDEHGGWVSGAVSPDLSAETLRLLRGSVLSGDWRDVNGNLELIALLAVNVPGFPVPRTRALVAAGDDGDRVLALVAAGIRPVAAEGVDDDTRAGLLALVARVEPVAPDDRDALAQLADRVA